MVFIFLASEPYHMVVLSTVQCRLSVFGVSLLINRPVQSQSLYSSKLNPRTNLMNELRKIDSSILNLDEISLTKLLLYGDSKFENKVNKKMLLASINFVLSTKRFEGQLT